MANVVEQFGKYMLLERLASGGMAEVYLARSSGAVGVNKFVAIKRILPQYSDNSEFISMFKEEAKITVNLNHSNIVSIYDFGIEKSQFFLVMEYVEGRNLRQILNEMKKTSSQFTIEQIVYMIKEVAAGLDHAHRCIDGTSGRPLNITHRDISPQNVMISFEGEVKIIDFGIAKAENQLDATKAGNLKGKFGYMSPEQADGQAIDLRTDVFSLGIVMWELLANDRLFTSNSEAAILRKIRECQIPSIRKINPSIPPELESIVNKALAKDKSLRYQTSAAFHRDLNRFLNTEYPEFSAHDFSVFVKNTFSQAFLEQRKKLVEFSKLQAPQGSQPTVEKTMVTQTQTETRSYAKAIGDNEQESDNLDIDTSTDVRISLDDIKTKNASLKREKALKTATNINPLTPLGPAAPTNTKTTSAQNNFNKTKTGVNAYPINYARPSSGPGFVGWTVRLMFFAAVLGGGWYVYNNKNQISDYTAKLLQSPPSKVQTPDTNPAPIEQQNPTTTVAQTDLPSTVEYTVIIESQPPGARIFINNEDTGSFTPNRRTLIGNKTYELILKKDGYLNYEEPVVATSNAQIFSKTLQLVPKAAYISIYIINGGANPVVEVNGRRLTEKMPVAKYTIPAGIPVLVHAHNPFTGASANQTIVMNENEKKSIELILK